MDLSTSLPPYPIVTHAEFEAEALRTAKRRLSAVVGVAVVMATLFGGLYARHYMGAGSPVTTTVVTQPAPSGGAMTMRNAQLALPAAVTTTASTSTSTTVVAPTTIALEPRSADATTHRVTAADVPVKLAHDLKLAKPSAAPATTTTAAPMVADYPANVAGRPLTAHLTAPGIDAPVYEGSGLPLAGSNAILDVGAEFWRGDMPCSSVGPTEILAHRSQGPGLFRAIDQLADGDTINVTTISSTYGNGHCTYRVFDRALLPVDQAKAELLAEARPGVLVLVACSNPDGSAGGESHRLLLYAKIT
jgi:sortase (surface protein transpeptidase)